MSPHPSPTSARGEVRPLVPHPIDPSSTETLEEATR